MGNSDDLEYRLILTDELKLRMIAVNPNEDYKPLMMTIRSTQRTSRYGYWGKEEYSMLLKIIACRSPKRAAVVDTIV